MKTEAEMGGMRPQARDTWGHQKLEEVRKDPPLEPSEGVWPYPHLDFRPLASRTVKEYISVVLSQPVCGTLLRQPQEVNAESKGCYTFRIYKRVSIWNMTYVPPFGIGLFQV